MPDKPQPDVSGDDNGDTPPDKTTASVRPGMNETQIRAAGLAIDVPFESGQPQADRLKYGDLGRTWTPPDGWPPDEGAATTTSDDEGEAEGATQ